MTYKRQFKTQYGVTITLTDEEIVRSYCDGHYFVIVTIYGTLIATIPDPGEFVIFRWI